MKTNFIPVDYDYFDFNGKNYAKIIGRDSSGKRVCVIDSCPVFLWAILEQGFPAEKIKKLVQEIGKIQLDLKGRQTKVEKVEVLDKNFLGQKVKALKIYATNYKDLHDIADRLALPGIEKRRGYDLGYTTHYIMEKKMIPLTWYEIEGEMLHNSNEFGGIDSSLDVDFCIKVKSFKPIEGGGNVGGNLVPLNFKPKVLVYDIECDEIKLGEGEILMISLVSDNFKKVLTWKKSDSAPDFVECLKDEAEMLEKFIEYVKKISPDFLVGYYSDGFDLPYIKARAELHKVKLALGLDGSQPRLTTGFDSSAKIKGITHIDLLRFIRTAFSQYMESETLSLDEVSREFLGDQKKKFEFRHSSKIKDHSEWNSYFEYCLHDSVLTLKLFEKFWQDLKEFSKITREPPYTLSRNGMSSNVEAFIVNNLERFNEIPEKRATYDEIAERRKLRAYEGAFVLEPVPGLYEDIAMFDFTSSYGSTIVTYNLSKSTLLESPEKNAYHIEVDGKEVYFSKKQGFFPEIFKEMIEKRKKYKQELKAKPDNVKKARSNSYKLLANAAYGYQGFFGARYYCREAAAATAAFARKTIIEVIEKINKSDYKVIYSDTDSIAFSRKGKTELEVLSLLKKLNSELPGIMELELEDFFTRGLWVTTRAGTIGAKKKYAMISKDDKIRIRGFETVRRDWCQLARRVQDYVLRQILKDGNEKKALEYVKEIIQKVKKREIQKNEIVIRTQLKKPISEYKAISPHVIAAKKMEERKIPVTMGSLIEYYIAEVQKGKKTKLVREKVKLLDEKGEYNIEYYLDRQIIPAVENIFQVFGIDIKQIISGKKQQTLGEF